MTAYPLMAPAAPVPESADPDVARNGRRADIFVPRWRRRDQYRLAVVRALNRNRCHDTTSQQDCDSSRQDQKFTFHGGFLSCQSELIRIHRCDSHSRLQVSSLTSKGSDKSIALNRPRLAELSRPLLPYLQERTGKGRADGILVRICNSTGSAMAQVTKTRLPEQQDGLCACSRHGTSPGQAEGRPQQPVALSANGPSPVVGWPPGGREICRPRVPCSTQVRAWAVPRGLVTPSP